MDNYVVAENINFVIIDNSIVVLDFNTGSFYLLEKEFLSIFQELERKGNKIIFNELKQDVKFLQELCENNIFVKIA